MEDIKSYQNWKKSFFLLTLLFTVNPLFAEEYYYHEDAYPEEAYSEEIVVEEFPSEPYEEYIEDSYAQDGYNNDEEYGYSDNKPIQLASTSFVYNPRTLSWKATKNGKVVRSGKGSGGKGYCKDVKRPCRTPSGTYRIISKGGPGCKSSRYPLGKGGAPMPYCMFFSKYYAIHGSPDVPNYNASHGCVRVRTHDAKWLNNHFLGIGSTVTIKSY